VKALVGGRDYGSSPFNRAVDARRQPGSSFKPFVFLAALEAGNYPESLRVDQPVSIRGWSPENYTRKYLGPVTLTSALALSLNTIAAQLTAEVGPATVAATARRLGIRSDLQATPSLALGTSEVSLLEMTGAYATFANGGRGVIPHVIARIRTEGGKVLYERAGEGPGQVVHPAHVAMMNAMLTETVASGTGRTAALPGWQAAGKTGTSQDFRDAWFIGYTAPMVTGVWFGNDDNRATKKATGSNIAASAWHRFMAEALEGVAVAALPGGYQPRDIGMLAAGGDPIGDQIAIVGEGGDVIRSGPQALPPPSAIPGPQRTIRMAPPPQQEKRGLFKRIFGG
jgi:penicillin-binding protein 1A